MNQNIFSSSFILLDPYDKNYIIINPKDSTYETFSTSFVERNVTDQIITVINEVRDYIGFSFSRHQLLMIINSDISRTELDSITKKVYKKSRNLIKTIQYISYETSFLSNNINEQISYNIYKNNWGTFGFVAFLGEPITDSFRIDEDTPTIEIMKTFDSICLKVIPERFLTEKEYSKYDPQKLWDKSAERNINSYHNQQQIYNKVGNLFLNGLIKYIERKSNLTLAST